MFRTIIVSQGERISIRDRWVVVNDGSAERKIPMDDIYSVVIDNPMASLTVPAMTALTSNGTHLLLCDEKHMPVTVVLAQNHHYRPLAVIRKQINLPETFKNDLWKRIVKGKVQNQARVLELCGVDQQRSERLYALADEVVPGDIGNREGIAAKMFFRSLFGTSFIRMNDDGINSALNYGYAILRSAVSKTLAAYGYNCVIGIHHINENNPFNLADDMMEPLRPIVDLWVDENHDDLFDELTKYHRYALINLVNHFMLFDGKRMRVRNVIDKYISSLTSAIEKQDASLLKIPIIIRNDPMNELDEDD
jgi:CRISPR-associated protein Cas1